MRVAVQAGGQQDGATVQFELPGAAGTETLGGQHGREGGGRVVGVVPMPERVPLPAADDRIERVVLQQQHPARGDTGHPLGQRRRLVRRVHQPETVEHHIGRFARRHRREAPLTQQIQPRAAVRAAVLGHPAALGQHPGRVGPGHRVGGLRDQGGRLGPRGSSGTVGSATS